MWVVLAIIGVLASPPAPAVRRAKDAPNSVFAKIH
jgi:hypothetical protein